MDKSVDRALRIGQRLRDRHQRENPKKIIVKALKPTLNEMSNK